MSCSSVKDLSLLMYLAWVTIQYYHHPLAYSTFTFSHTISVAL